MSSATGKPPPPRGAFHPTSGLTWDSALFVGSPPRAPPKSADQQEGPAGQAHGGAGKAQPCRLGLGWPEALGPQQMAGGSCACSLIRHINC